MKMSLNKGYSGVAIHRTIIYGSLLLFLGFFYPGIPELRSSVCPENILAKVYPVDIFNARFPDFRIFSIKQDIPFNPLTNKHSTDNAKPQPLSDQCYFKVGHRLIADKGPESALLAFSGIFFGYPLNPISFISHLPFLIFSSGNGSSLKIRPPPVL